jgi:hypothetical protein
MNADRVETQERTGSLPAFFVLLLLILGIAAAVSLTRRPTPSAPDPSPGGTSDGASP